MNDDFGFIILCLEPNIGLLKDTVKSIELYQSRPYIGVASSEAGTSVIKEMKDNVCKVYKAKDTVTSMMNTGLRNSPADWGIFVVAGTWVKKNIWRKYRHFAKNESDILFPVAEDKYSFTECTLNGLCINKKTFKAVGPFAEKGDLTKLREEWAIHASSICNSKFKAILGAYIC